MEVEAVKFLKEEPHKLDSMLKRVRTLTDTLSNLRRYRLREKKIETDVSIANIIRLWLIKYFMTNFMDLLIPATYPSSQSIMEMNMPFLFFIFHSDCNHV